jgi:hypothetical protein
VSTIGICARPRPRHDSLPAGSLDITRLRRRAKPVLPAVFNDRAAHVPPRPRPWIHWRSSADGRPESARLSRRLLNMRTLITGAVWFTASTVIDRLPAECATGRFESTPSAPAWRG